MERSKDNFNKETKGQPKEAFGVAARPVRADGFVDIYSNVSKMTISPFDFAVTFGRTTDHSEFGNIVEELVTVRFSPHHFKAIVESFVNSIDGWESAFGAIVRTAPGPDNRQAIMESAERMKNAIVKDRGQASE